MSKLFSVAFFVLFALASCSASLSTGVSETDTLRYSADTLDENTKWTFDLEGGVLSEEFNSIDGFSSEFSAEADNIFMSVDNGVVYPEVAGFASLDVSVMDAGARAELSSFCDDFIDGESYEAHFPREYIYSLVMFLYDFEREFGEKSLSWYVIGSPFDGGDFYQCPVRFVFKDKKSKTSREQKFYLDAHIDVYVYVGLFSKDWKVFQLELIGG